MRKFQYISAALFLLFASIGAFSQPDSDFRKYWYQGKAELTRYSLEQARYGEIHKGEAVLIFVTEPFLKDKQVKYEHGDKKNSLSVLKLNFTRKFYTGLYPYSMMTSTFTPVDIRNNRTMKITSSTQEWCGHTFTQLNWKNDRYDGLLRSYFQDEGDRNVQVKTRWLEDEIWTHIRLAPKSLPSGDVEIVPALQYLRLGHQELQPARAKATINKQGKLNVYTIDYPALKRQVTIRFEEQFPHTIVSWEEKSPGGFTSGAPLLTTKAVKTNTILLDYWNKHGVKDAAYRKQLGLTQ